MLARLSGARQWNHPRFLLLHPDQAVAGGHTAEVRLHARAGFHAGLSRVFVGEQADLEEAYRKLEWLRTQAMLLAAGSVLMLGVIVWLIASVTRWTALNWAGAAMVLWAVSLTGFESEVAWLRGGLWEIAYFAARVSYAYCAALFILRFFVRPMPVFERVLFAIWAVNLLVLVAAWPSGFLAVSSVSFGVSSSAVFLVLVYVLFRRQGRRDPEATTIAGAIMVAHVFNLHDALWWNGAIEFGEPLLNHFAAIGFYAIVYVLLRRYTSMFAELTALKRNLERRVEERSREVAAGLVKIQALERDRAVMAERERLMSDMHDGVSTQVASALAAVETGRVSAADIAPMLRNLLHEIRMVIRSLDPAMANPAAVIAALRYRMSERGIAEEGRLAWDVGEGLERLRLTPAQSLNLMRILQEAIANAVRHSGARSISVVARAVPEERALSVRVVDDGSGFDAAAASGGYGLASMRRRARAIGAAFAVDARPQGGTEVSIRMSAPP